MAKADDTTDTDYTVEQDGSVTFRTQDVTDEVREKAYLEAARQRAAATQVDPEELEALARESAEAVDHSIQREQATEVDK